MGLTPVSTVKVRNAMGTQERDVVVAKMRIGRVTYDVEMTVADRSHMKCPMLLGKEFLDELVQLPLRPNDQSNVPQFV